MSASRTTVDIVVVLPRTRSEIPHTVTKVTAPLPNGVWGELTTYEFPKADISAIRWTPAPVTAPLGLPLQTSRLATDDGDRPNGVVNGLFMIYDPEHPDFGSVQRGT